MNTPETLNDSVESKERKEPVKLLEMAIDDFLALPSQERRDCHCAYMHGCFTPEQIRELWQRRDELDFNAFQMMTMSATYIFDDEYDYMYEHEDDPDYSPARLEEMKKLRKICPFTGLEADTRVSPYGFDHLWLGENDIKINSSIIKDLMKLAQRVGAGVDEMSILGNDGRLFACDHRGKTMAEWEAGNFDGGSIEIEIEDKLGVLDEEKYIGEVVSERLKLQDRLKNGKDVQVKIEIETPKGTKTIFAVVAQSFREKFGETLSENVAS